MREKKEKRGWAQNKLVGRDDLGRVHDEESPRRPDRLAIPHYVMWDFGYLEEEDRDNGIRT